MKHPFESVFRFYNTFDDEPMADPPAAPPASTTPASGGSPKVLTLTREELQSKISAAVSARSGELEETHTNLMQEMELLKTRSTMNAEERTAHEARVKELENKLLTTEELAKREQQKIANARKKETTELAEERDYWTSLYRQERIIRGISDAAVTHEAVSPEQMVSMLSNSTKLVERDTGDGKKVYDVMTSILDKGEDGKTITLELEVSKAIEHMSQQKRYYNLFKAGIKSGFNQGGSDGSGGGQSSESEIAKDPKKWRIYSREKRGKVK